MMTPRDIRGTRPVDKLGAEFFAIDRELAGAGTDESDHNMLLEKWLSVGNAMVSVTAYTRSERKAKAAVVLAVYRRLSPPQGLFADLAVSLATDLWRVS